MCRILPESVVWLCANNRVDEAERIIRNAARLNNIEMPENILAGKSTELDETGAAAERIDDRGKVDDEGEAKDKKKDGNLLVKFTNMARLRRGQKKDEDSAVARYTLLDVFRNLRLTLYCVCMAILWSVTSCQSSIHQCRNSVKTIGHVRNFCGNLLRVRADVSALTSCTCKLTVSTTVFVVLLQVH